MNNFKEKIDKRFEELKIKNEKDFFMSKKLLRKTFPLRNLIAACICVCFLTTIAITIFASTNSEPFYMRFLSPQFMALSDAAAEQYGSKVYFDGLKSDDTFTQYFSINKLVEYFKDKEISEKAIKELTPFLSSENEQLKRAAEFAVSILTQTYDNQDIYKLNDGTVIFTLFNDYSDYGSYNELMMIKDGEMRVYFPFSNPHMYITSITVSPDGKNFAVTTCSNKSVYLFVSDLENGLISPELVDSVKFKAAFDKNYPLYQRVDFENYCGFSTPIKWLDENTVEYGVYLTFNDTEFFEKLTATYNLKTREIAYTQ